MTFRQLEYFLEVARTLNFSKAAENLFVSQSTLSKAIAMLEAELGAVLFVRDRHKVSLTPAGAVLATNLPRLQEDLARTIDLVQEVKEGMRGRLAIGAPFGLPFPDVVVSALSYCRHSMPFLNASVACMDDDRLQDSLANGTIDFALGYRVEGGAPEDAPGTRSVVVEAHPVVLCASKFAKIGDDPSPRELARFSYAFTELPGSPIVRRWFDYCRASGFYPTVVRAGNAETAVAMVEADLAVAVVPEGHQMTRSPNVRAIAVADAYRIATVMTYNTSNLNQIVGVFTRLIEADL